MPWKRMTASSSIAFVIGIILVGFILYIVLRDWIFGKTLDGYENNYRPADGPLEIRQAPLEPPRTITPSGPSPPAQAAPPSEAVVYGEPSAIDHYADHMEASDAPENMRYPERSFRPTPPNNQTGLAAEAGIAGGPGQTSPQAYQQFSTDFVQNSGEFMGGVYANDSDSPANFSAF